MEAIFFSFCQASKRAKVALHNSSDVFAALEMDYFTSSFTAEIEHTFHHLFCLRLDIVYRVMLPASLPSTAKLKSVPLQIAAKYPVLSYSEA